MIKFKNAKRLLYKDSKFIVFIRNYVIGFRKNLDYYFLLKNLIYV